MLKVLPQLQLVLNSTVVKYFHFAGAVLEFRIRLNKSGILNFKCHMNKNNTFTVLCYIKAN